MRCSRGSRFAALAGAATIMIAASVGCGSDGDGAAPTAPTVVAPPERLTPAEVRVIDQTQQQVIAYCQHVARVVQTPGRVPDPERFSRVSEAIDELAALAAAKPEGETPDGISARLALGDIAENLQGTNCDNRLVERINQELAEL